MGASTRQSVFSEAAAPRKTSSAIAEPMYAVRSETAPVTSSRPAVRGLRASSSRSMIRFAAIAKVRRPTMAMVTTSSWPQCTRLSARNIAVRLAM